ncbi:MAG: ABC transporter ATP-binding protein [Planctomycetes bacterium]|nr:ABC transporter ATP-binding protein [Planctomycetota bacterium]MCB9890846.1 ABC transporter ATP-binding protein [Planctomycetota bacterium]
MQERAEPKALELEHLTVAYGDFTALSDFTTTFDGGTCGLLGPNGAGKSTLNRTLLGLVTPVSGTARVMGIDIAEDPIEVRRRIGYMPERDAFVPGANAVRSLTYLAQLSGLCFREARNRAHEALYYVGLGEARYRPIQDYSTGMRQRARLAMALVHDPDMVLLDEPTNGMDPAGRADMLRLVRDIANKGIHVFMASHLLPDIEQVCDRILMIDRGRLVRGGTLDELRRTENVVHRVSLRGDEAAFLERARISDTFRVESQETEDRTGKTFDVIVHPGHGEPTGTTAIFALAHAAGATVLSLQQERRSLEDIFMETLGVPERSPRTPQGNS